MKRLCLHLGFPKTGSSAIQAFMASHKPLLEQEGFFYNAPEMSTRTEATCGNATPLFDALQNLHISEVLHFLDAHTAPDKLSIISSEALASLTPDRWATFLWACKAKGILLEKILFYLRNVDSFLKSAYDQVLKRHGYTGDFPQFVEIANWEHYTTCRTLKQVFDPGLFVPLHYESSKDHLLNSFFSQFGEVRPEFQHQIATANQMMVNRSLTALERDYLDRINSRFGEVYSKKLSDRFLSQNPKAAKSELPLEEASCHIVHQRFQDQVDWVNAHFFAGASVVSCLSEKTAAPSRVSNTEEDALTRQIMEEFLLDELASVFSESTAFVQSHLLAIITKAKPIPPDFPADFSFLQYALLNPDLLIRKIDLEAHYRQYGQFEKRKYRL